MQWIVNTMVFFLVWSAVSIATALVVGPWMGRLDRVPAVVRVKKPEFPASRPR